jgi:hypothetical protein
MPFIHTQVHQDTPQQQRQGIVDGIHQALVDAIGMPEDELFNRVSAYAPGDFFYSRSFNGMARSDKLVVVEITMRRGRWYAMNRDMYARFARNLMANAGVARVEFFLFTN